eukprot:SAG11_NODE_1121_length_5789_cov_2.695079_5_plen_217_part_00
MQLTKPDQGRRPILDAPSGFAAPELQVVLDKDVALLRKHQLIDYSLLTGVHLLPPCECLDGDTMSGMRSEEGGAHVAQPWIGPQWKARHKYCEGDRVYPVELQDQGLCYVCCQRGVSSSNMPHWISRVGEGAFIKPVLKCTPQLLCCAHVDGWCEQARAQSSWTPIPTSVSAASNGGVSSSVVLWDDTAPTAPCSRSRAAPPVAPRQVAPLSPPHR